VPRTGAAAAAAAAAAARPPRPAQASAELCRPLPGEVAPVGGVVHGLGGHGRCVGREAVAPRVRAGRLVVGRVVGGRGSVGERGRGRKRRVVVEGDRQPVVVGRGVVRGLRRGRCWRRVGLGQISRRRRRRGRAGRGSVLGGLVAVGVGGFRPAPERIHDGL